MANRATTAGGPWLGLARLQTFSSLKYRDYRYLWTSTFFSAGGDWIQQVTLGWLAYELTKSPFIVATLQASRSFPFLVVGPISGVLSDRMDRRKLLIANQIFVALSALFLAILVSTDVVKTWHLYVFTVLNGAGFAMNTPLRQALVIQTVPRTEMMNAVALNSTAININRVIGPAIGGVLIAIFGPGTNFFIQAVCYVCVAAMVFQVHVRSDSNESQRSARRSYASDLREGLEYVLARRQLFALILLSFIPSLFLMPFTTGLMPVFAKDELGLGSKGLGLLLSMIGAGGLVGTLMIATIGGKGHSGVAQIGGATVGGLALIGASIFTAVPTVVVCFTCLGMCQMIFIVSNNTVVQQMTTDELRGRVMSIYLLNLGMAPFGSFLAGPLAARFGAAQAMTIGGLCTIGLGTLVAVRYQLIRLPWQAPLAQAE